MIPPESGGQQLKESDPKYGANLKTLMDIACDEAKKAKKKFQKSFSGAVVIGNNMADIPNLINPVYFSVSSGGRTSKITFTTLSSQASLLHNSVGVAWGFPKGLEYAGQFTKESGDALSIPNAAHLASTGSSTITNTGGRIRLGRTTDQFYIDYKDYARKKQECITKTNQYNAWKKKYQKTPPQTSNGGGGGGGGGGATPPAAATTYAYGDTSLKYNLGAINEMYLSAGTTAAGLTIGGGNQPRRRVGNAQELWTDKHYVTKKDPKNAKKTITTMEDNVGKSAYKGMVQSYTRPAAQTTTGGTQETHPSKSLNPFRMGFQFHYNPSRISTQWQGNVNVDVGYVASGKDKFGPMGAALATGSGLTVNIPLNRMADMKYVNTSEKDWDTMPWQELYGVAIKEAPANGKETPAPTFEDLRKIRDLGTMYDVEFLLQTIIGYRMKSAIRLNRHALTSDLGYLGGLPVELHLGKNIRYYVSITHISINHSIFTKDMVPMLSELTFSCSRLPDYIQK